MEFANQRGDSVSPWSVGKHAKRSATIHLCSEDAQFQKHTFFEAVVASYDPGNHAVTVLDPGKLIKDKLATAQEPTAELRTPAMGLDYNSSSVALFGGTGVSAAGDDFTKVLVSAEYAGFNAHTNPFTPVTVRTVDTTANFNDLALLATDQINVIRQAGKVFFNVHAAAFPDGITGDLARVRLSQDFTQDAAAYVQQINKGYVMELVEYTIATPTDAATTASYYVPNLRYQKDAELMGHSVATQGDYVKTD